MDLSVIQENYPYLTILRHFGEDYVVVFQNHDDKIVSFYDLALVKDADARKNLLKLADIWWYESNRMLPISIFLSAYMKPYKQYIRTLPYKDITIITGPTVSLNSLIQKRIKRREIKLIRRTQ